ncbi:MAG TPA: tetratricopeptide repeat protein [Blastocatellia bacterium]|nr:tetratricopeptide repeat protein [Blastocatellia bacterium]
MAGRKIFPFVFLLCFTLVAFLPSAPAQSPMPADRKAYMEAARIKEPDKKIAAMEKFIADFPRSQSVTFAHQAIFEVLVKNHPDQKDKILASAGKAVETASDFLKTSLYNDLAAKLFEAGILLDEAEKLAIKGLAVTEEELAKQARHLKTGYYATLGHIYLKQGKLADAEKNLKQAYEFNPQLSSASIGLAELYLKQGNEKLALESYATAAVSGKLPAESRKQMETLYSKSHQGSLAGLEEMLDAKYNQLYPLPVKFDHYKPSAKRTNRTVLAEIFTGSGCTACAAADLGFDAMMERYKRDELAVLMYHLHIPEPDPMTNPATQARSNFYGVQGLPGYALDGRQQSGGGSRDMAQEFYDRVNPDVEKRLETAAEADLKLDALMDGPTIKAKATVSNVRSDSTGLKLHIVLAEDKLRYNGENGIRFHPMVVRSVAGPGYGGFAVTAKDSQSFEWTFDIKAISAEARKHLDEYEKAGHHGEPFTFGEKKDQIDPDNLTLVAFVQDEKTKAILQTTSMKLKRQVASSNNQEQYGMEAR